MTIPLPTGSNRPGALACCTGEDLELAGTAPALGPFPELRTYRCRRCGHVETVEAPRRSAS